MNDLWNHQEVRKYSHVIVDMGEHKFWTITLNARSLLITLLHRFKEEHSCKMIDCPQDTYLLSVTSKWK